MPPRISVIIPVHNRRVYLERALNSVFAQTYSNYEVICVDDGSSQPHEAWLAIKFPSVKYIHQTHRGVSQARNTGIKEASGEWIALLDSDDEWLQDKLDRQVQALKSTQLKVCHCDEIWIRNAIRVNPASKHKKHGGNIFEYCLRLCSMSPSSIMIHRQVFEQIGLFDSRLPACEDYDLWLRISVHYTVCYLDQHLVIRYAGHKDQLSKQYWGMDRFRIRALEKLLKHTQLSDQQRQLVIESLLDKITLFSKGALKHSKQIRHQRYQVKFQHYQAQLHSLL